MKHILKIIESYLVDRWWQVRGPAFKNPPIPPVVSLIVFICKGNICRSAFAQYEAFKALRNLRQKSIRITSAGLKARPGTLSPAMAIQVAKLFGIDMGPHRARLLTEDIVKDADMLILMEPGQMREMRKKYPRKWQNIFLLPLFADGWDRDFSGWKRYHIQDPYGKEQGEFVESFSRVRGSVEGLMNRLTK